MTDLDRTIRGGDLRALARAATGDREPRRRGVALLREMAPLDRARLIVGITGPPGAGKSTLVDALVGIARAAGRRSP